MTLREKLDEIYGAINRRASVHPDPVEFLYAYPKTEDREIVALIAASLAYGRVGHILKSVEYVLRELGPSPSAFVDRFSAREAADCFHRFKHRWTTSAHITDLLLALKRMRMRNGTLGDCFAMGMEPEHETVLPALTLWVNQLQGGALISDPGKGSACKRLHLFLRWMVRRDDVDPGGWDGVSRAKLIVPMDVHMHRISRLLKMTKRKQANHAAAIEVTQAFRKICPDDPVKYDFALTRYGIAEGMTEADIRREIQSWGRLTARR